jgi:hypothetical protein
MSVHPNGLGDSWVETAPDIDQPHGLDYRSLQDLRKGVRKRLNKEHVVFGDLTVGGEHVPGRCQVVAMVDGTADVTKPFSDGSYMGHNLVWDTSSRVWCITCDNSYTGETPKVIAMNPNDQWNGGDVTWAGEHQFDNTVTFIDKVSIHTDATMTIAGQVDCTGIAKIFGDLTRKTNNTQALTNDITYYVSGDGFLTVKADVSTESPVNTDSFVRIWTHTGQPVSGGMVISCICLNFASAGNDIHIGKTITAPIRKGYYWCISKSTIATIVDVWWQPIGAAICYSAT